LRKTVQRIAIPPTEEATTIRTVNVMFLVLDVEAAFSVAVSVASAAVTEAV